MTFVYDILLNFTDEERIIEFFEWEQNDILEHVKKIPIIRVSTKQLNDILTSNIKIEQEFLKKIKDTTILYKKTRSLEYAVLISDLNKVIGLEFNKDGNIISKSSLLLAEEEDLIEECFDLKEQTLSYEVIEKLPNMNFLTREEVRKKRYLLKEIENIFLNKEYDKLNYLYFELYKQDELSIKDKYLKIKNDIETNYSSKHNNLYDIVRLTYMKK